MPRGVESDKMFPRESGPGDCPSVGGDRVLNSEPTESLASLTAYLLAVEIGDDSADDRLDELIARIPREELLAAVLNLLASGPAASWMGAVNLAGLLAGEFGEVWATLAKAIETRHDLGTMHQMAGIALLQVGGQVPEMGRCRELADEWSEFPQTGQNAILKQVETEPESAFLILEGLGETAPAERWELVQEMLERESTLKPRMLRWLCLVPDARIAAYAAAELEKCNHTADQLDSAIAFEPPFFGWVTDLTPAGQFGAGVEWTGEVNQQVVMGGSWSQGMRLFERLDVEGETDDHDFIPDLKPPRQVCTHLTLIKKWCVALMETGWHKAAQPTRSAWSAGLIHEMLSVWTDEDEIAWENWSRILIENNPVNSNADALQSDATLVCSALPHWFVPDELARELATELRGKSGDVFEHRLQSAARLWFERSLGPGIGLLLGHLHAMSYFWLALAETDVMNQQKLVGQARAAARLVADLNDPARIVATHPMVKAWSETMLRTAMI